MSRPDKWAWDHAKELGIKLPEHYYIVDINDEAYNMMVISGVLDYPHALHLFLCSPLGCIRVPWTKVPWEEGHITVWQVAKALGIKIPHRKDQRTWENIEPYWVAVALSKL